ncbi:MAG: hypothetical protein ACXWPO_09110 [Candidatus Limnocylindrales bacterium]
MLRSQVIGAFEQAGITLEQVEVGLAAGRMNLAYIDRFYPDPGPRSGRTDAEFDATLGGS